MSTMDTTCLYTTLVNISGSTKKFSFIPPHGKELTAAEEVTVFGNILEAVNRGDRFGSRHMDALKAAIEDDYILIKNTPAPVLYDAVLDHTQILTLVNDSVVVDTPCWGTSTA